MKEPASDKPGFALDNPWLHQVAWISMAGNTVLANYLNEKRQWPNKKLHYDVDVQPIIWGVIYEKKEKQKQTNTEKINWRMFILLPDTRRMDKWVKWDTEE